MERIKQYLKQTYTLTDTDKYLSWYLRLSQYYLDAGVPEEGVLGLLKEHPIPLEMVKRNGFSSGLVPENVAKNILTQREPPKTYDVLADPIIRATKKRIEEFRKALEEELRRLWGKSGWDGIEDYVKEYCIEPTDSEIAEKVERGIVPKIWAENIQDFL